MATKTRNVPIKAIWPGEPYPPAPPGTARASISPCSPSTRPRSSCACSIAERARGICSASRLREQTDLVWHCYLPDVPPGQLYGYRVMVRTSPNGPSLQSEQVAARSLRQGASAGDLRGPTRMFGYGSVTSSRTSPSIAATTPSACPLAVVVDPAFIWGDDRPPHTPWHRDGHLRDAREGFDAAAPGCSASRSRHLCRAASERRRSRTCSDLGVTAVELMPVHHHVDDRHLVERGLRNYWGYNTLASSPRTRATPPPAARAVANSSGW